MIMSSEIPGDSNFERHRVSGYEGSAAHEAYAATRTAMVTHYLFSDSEGRVELDLDGMYAVLATRRVERAGSATSSQLGVAALESLVELQAPSASEPEVKKRWGILRRRGAESPSEGSASSSATHSFELTLSSATMDAVTLNFLEVTVGELPSWHVIGTRETFSSDGLAQQKLTPNDLALWLTALPDMLSEATPVPADEKRAAIERQARRPCNEVVGAEAEAVQEITEHILSIRQGQPLSAKDETERPIDRSFVVMSETSPIAEFRGSIRSSQVIPNHFHGLHGIGRSVMGEYTLSDQPLEHMGVEIPAGLVVRCEGVYGQSDSRRLGLHVGFHRKLLKRDPRNPLAKYAPASLWPDQRAAVYDLLQQYFGGETDLI